MEFFFTVIQILLLKFKDIFFKISTYLDVFADSSLQYKVNFGRDFVGGGDGLKRQKEMFIVRE
jgi:hypothetical protein